MKFCNLYTLLLWTQLTEPFREVHISMAAFNQRTEKFLHCIFLIPQIEDEFHAAHISTFHLAWWAHCVWECPWSEMILVHLANMSLISWLVNFSTFFKSWLCSVLYWRHYKGNITKKNKRLRLYNESTTIYLLVWFRRISEQFNLLLLLIQAPSGCSYA